MKCRVWPRQIAETPIRSWSRNLYAFALGVGDAIASAGVKSRSTEPHWGGAQPTVGKIMRRLAEIVPQRAETTLRLAEIEVRLAKMGSQRVEMACNATELVPAIARLHLIRQAKRFGFALDEIHSIDSKEGGTAASENRAARPPN